MHSKFMFVVCVSLGIALDQYSKHLVFANWSPGESQALVDGILHLTPSLNTGVAFSFLQHSPGLVLAIGCLATPAILLWICLTWKQARFPLLAAQTLLLSGAVGNLVDRVAFGSVRDFVDFKPEIPLIGHWAIFNFADTFICVGVGFYVVNELFFQSPSQPGTAVPQPDGASSSNSTFRSSERHG